MIISTNKYFLMLIGINLIPLVYVVIMGYLFFPREPYLFLDDPFAASILELNISNPMAVPLGGLAPLVTNSHFNNNKAI